MGLINYIRDYIKSSEDRYVKNLGVIAASALVLGNALKTSDFNTRMKKAEILPHHVEQGETLGQYAACEGLEAFTGLSFRKDVYVNTTIEDSQQPLARTRGFQRMEDARDLKAGMSVGLRDYNRDGLVGCEQPEAAGY